MKKNVFKLLSYVLVACVASLTTLCCCYFSVRKDQGKLRELERLLSRCFIGEMDQTAVEDAAAEAMVDALGDMWSHYMTREEYLAYQDTMSNSYVGIGITVKARQDGQGFDVVGVNAGGPAESAGIRAGDRVVAVDGASALEMESGALTSAIRGEEGTKLEITVVRDGAQRSFSVERRRLETVVASYQMLEDGIGLITIENFDERCAQETIGAVEALMDQGAKALIFDVRDNPGGYKRELVQILDYLLPEGELFRTVDYRGKEEVDRSDADHIDLPMAVVMDLQSYSAAEFFAAALDEYDAAVTVGTKTFGKGYFQNTFQLSDGSAVTLSVGKYFTPKGVSLAGVGLTPDVEVAVDPETESKIAAGTLEPEEDPQLQAAIQALKEKL